MLTNTPHFKRVLISREEKIEEEKNEFLKEKEDINKDIVTIVAVGESCEDLVKQLLDKKVMISSTSAIKVGEGLFLIPQEAILMS